MILEIGYLVVIEHVTICGKREFQNGKAGRDKKRMKTESSHKYGQMIISLKILFLKSKSESTGSFQINRYCIMMRKMKMMMMNCF